MIVAPEDGTASPLDAQDKSEAKPTGAVSTAGEVKEAFPDRASVVKDLIWQALNGTLPVARPLKEGEVRCFTARHINMVFDAVQGPMTNTELVERYQMHPSTVSEILNHPFSDVLKAALLGQIADNLADPLQRMRAYTHEMIDIKVQIARNPSTPAQLRNKVANDFLDRVGYGPKIKIEEERKDQGVPLPAPVLERFSQALEGSARVASLGYGQFVQRGGAVGGESKDSSATARQPEQGTDVVEGLPGASAVPASSQEERAA